MSIVPVRVFPDPILKIPSRPVEHITSEIRRLIDELIETMRAHPRCVGLAAPQVGASLRIAVVDVSAHPKAAHAHGLLVLVNPQRLTHAGTVIQREGCLSIPHLTANVQRAVRLQVAARDETGRSWARWFEGFEAIAVQHEIDHLEGKLFLDRVANLKRDVFRRKQYWFPHPQSGTTR